MSYKVGDREYDFWSSKNQTILDKLVGREIYCCVTSVVEYILQQDDSNAPFSWDDVETEPRKICSECDYKDNFTENEDGTYTCDHCHKVYDEDEYENLDDLEDEIYEWWAVSCWFADKLKEKGNAIIESGCCSYWGRGCTGQAIALDGVIAHIGYDMEILEGQKYDWSK